MTCRSYHRPYPVLINISLRHTPSIYTYIQSKTQKKLTDLANGKIRLNLERCEHSVKAGGFPHKVNAKVPRTLCRYISHSFQLQPHFLPKGVWDLNHVTFVCPCFP